jgi:TRAP-type C4-dicarboxylate transport system permease small subunit
LKGEIALEKFIQRLDNIGAKIAVVCKILLGIQLAVLTIIVVVQVALRPVGIGMPWATEFCCALFVWASLLGSALASRYLLHIGVDAVKDRLKGKFKKVFLIISNLVLCFGLIVFTVSSFNYTLTQMDHMMTTLPDISLAVFYCSLPICGVIMLYYTIVQFLQIITMGDAVKIEIPGFEYE